MTSIKNPKPYELDDVLDFMVRCDIAEFGKPESSREDLEEQWSVIDLTRDAWIARNENGIVVGYADILERERGFSQDVYVLDEFSPAGLEDLLMHKCEERARESIVAGQKYDKLRITGFITNSDMNQKLRLAFEKSGFQIHTYHYQMKVDFNEPQQFPAWPEQYHVDSFREGNEHELYQLIESAFTWAGREVSSFEFWQNHLFRGGRYDPDLFILVRDAGRIIGAVLAYDEGDRGWIRQLAVHKDYQGKGLGTLLLRYIFALFSQRGITCAGLGVASLNQTAYQFYERNGMYRNCEYIEFQKRLEL